MTNWLLRAQREFPQSAGRVTANSAERNPMAVTAVPEGGESENARASIGSNGSAALEGLRKIEAANETTVLMTQSEASALPRHMAFDDDQRRCDQCANLTGRGLCLAARRGEIVASRTYEPVRDLPRRCEGYAPAPDDTDHRPGRERWPGLIEKGDDYGNS